MKRVILTTITLLTLLESALAIGGVDKPPAPGPAPQVHFVRPSETKLDNGLRVIVAERPSLPLVAVQLLVRSGSELDPPNRGGVASMTGTLLTKGTESMSAPQIAEAIESLGGMIFSGGGWDSSDAAVVVMSNKLDAALGILADVALRPTFKPEEIERLRRQRLDGLRVALQQPGTVASYVATRVLFPEGEYSHPSGGTMETLQAIRREDIVALYHRAYRPENCALVFVGDITAEEAKRRAKQFFGDWKADALAEATPSPQKTDDWKPQQVIIDMAQAGQAAVNIYKQAIRRNSPDYYNGIVANAALGRGFASRLNREIRIKRGLSYGATSSLDARRDAGVFSAGAQTKNESAAEVAKLLITETEKLSRDPVQADELKSREAMLIGNYARSMETNFGIVGEVSNLIVNGLPLDTLDKFIAAVNNVTAPDVTAFAKKYLTVPGALVIAGKAGAFGETMKKDFPDVKVIPTSELDLNRADLTTAK